MLFHHINEMTTKKGEWIEENSFQCSGRWYYYATENFNNSHISQNFF